MGVVALAGVGLFSTGSVAQADTTQMYRSTQQALNGSGASANVTVSTDGTNITVNINATGLTPGAPHAQHLHIGGQNVCPTASADTDGDGLVNTAEGQPAYGGVKVSLTTSGDTSPSSALAVDRFPTADSSGNLSYSRTFALPDGVTAQDVANAVVVQHGIDLNGNGMYDGDAKSSLDPGLPLEATIPADCGKLVATQMQPPSTGDGGLLNQDGSGSGIPTDLAAAGVIALIAGATFVVVRKSQAVRR